MKSKNLVKNKGKKVTHFHRRNKLYIYWVHRVGWLPWWGTPCYPCHKWRWQCLVWKTMDLFSILSCIWIPFHLRAAKIPSTIVLSLNISYSVLLHTRQRDYPTNHSYMLRKTFLACPSPTTLTLLHSTHAHPLYTLQLPGNIFHAPVFRYNSSKMPPQLGPYIWGSRANPELSVLPSPLH